MYLFFNILNRLSSYNNSTIPEDEDDQQLMFKF